MPTVRSSRLQQPAAPSHVDAPGVAPNKRAAAATTPGVKRQDSFEPARSQGPNRPAGGGERAMLPTAFARSRDGFFAALDQDPALRAKAQTDAVGALLDVLGSTQVPPELDREYAEKAGSTGGGRVLLALDYTRGIPSNETMLDALKAGPMHLVSSKIVTPMLTHFREVNGASLFPGDATMTPAFRDSSLWGPKTNQVGHMLCAVEAGVRLGQLSKAPIERRVFDVALMAAGGLVGFKNVQGNAADWSRAGILGHEMRGDDDGSGFLGQMKAYDALVANGDPAGIRTHWDQAVAAAMSNKHQEAWTHIKAMGAAMEAPATPQEVAANKENEHPRFTAPHASRDGNSLEDVALSVYGFATGYTAATKGFPTAAAAREHFEALYSAAGSQVAAVDAAAGLVP